MSEQKSIVQSMQPGDFWLIGLRMDPNFPDPDFYTILREDPPYWPIIHKGQIIFFHEIEAAQQALDFFLHHLNLPSRVAPNQLAVFLDFAQAFYLLSEESHDDTSCLLNIINTVLDMLKATSIKLPVMYRVDLYQFADHLTFSREFESFLKDQQLDRAEIIEALQWALGAVMTKSMFFPKPKCLAQVEGKPA